MLIRPTYNTGYATCAAESRYPHLWKGLVGAWVPALGSTGTVLRDVSGYGNHATLSGGLDQSSWVLDRGWSIDFGTSKGSQRISLTGLRELEGNKSTLFCRVLMRSADAFGTCPLTYNTGTNYWQITGGQIIRIHTQNVGSSIGSPNLWDSQWHDMVFKTTGGTQEFWWDRQLLRSDTDTSTSFPAGEKSFEMWSQTGNNWTLDGRIHSVLLWNYALGTSDLLMLGKDLAPLQRRDSAIVLPSAAPAGLSIPIAAYHYNHSLGSNG